MAAERTNLSNGNQLRNASNALISTPQTINRPNGNPGAPPPLPPRQPVQSYSGYNDYRPFGSNYYGGYGGFGGYGGYGGYGSPYRGYGGYGSYNSYSPYSGTSGYGNYGPGGPGDAESRFLQYAEESTRSTFRVVETVLQTFSSTTMLLESTYFAMTNSFKAILSVAENLGRLRSTIGQLASTFALVRFLKWIYARLARLAGLRRPGSEDEELWERSLAKVSGDNSTSSSPWAGVLLFSVFVLIPYAIHKIASTAKNIAAKSAEPKDWQRSEEPVYVASVLYDFTAANNNELSVRAGQKIILAPQTVQPKNLPGWRLATDKANVGLVPYNYIAVVGRLQKKEKNDAEMKETSLLAEEKTVENVSRNGPEVLGTTAEENVVKESS